jgi:hypothetical protein
MIVAVRRISNKGRFNRESASAPEQEPTNTQTH